MFAWALNTPVYNLHPFKKDTAITSINYSH